MRGVGEWVLRWESSEVVRIHVSVIGGVLAC